MASSVSSSYEGAVVLVSNDGVRHTVKLEVAKVFRALEAMMEAGVLDHTMCEEPIPLPNVNGKMLGKIVAWAEEYVRSQTPPPAMPPSQSSVQSVVPVQPTIKQPIIPRRRVNVPPAIAEPSLWEQQFIEKNKQELYDLLLAANYLDAKRLMDILCNAVASKIRGKDPAEIRRTFNATIPESDTTLDNESITSEHDKTSQTT